MEEEEVTEVVAATLALTVVIVIIVVEVLLISHLSAPVFNSVVPVVSFALFFSNDIYT